jgi:hypothetical protein
MDQQKNYRIKYKSRVTSEYEELLNRWDGEITRDNERCIIGLEFNRKI